MLTFLLLLFIAFLFGIIFSRTALAEMMFEIQANLDIFWLGATHKAGGEVC